VRKFNITLSTVASGRWLRLNTYFPCLITSKPFLNHVFLTLRISDVLMHPLDLRTVHNIATALMHSKLDYCNSAFLNFPANQLDRLLLILNSAARAVT
jgi:hypothetical protein